MDVIEERINELEKMIDQEAKKNGLSVLYDAYRTLRIDYLQDKRTRESLTKLYDAVAEGRAKYGKEEYEKGDLYKAFKNLLKNSYRRKTGHSEIYLEEFENPDLDQKIILQRLKDADAKRLEQLLKDIRENREKYGSNYYVGEGPEPMPRIVGRKNK